MSAKKTIGPWELKRKIGSGGNGEVWECADQAGKETRGHFSTCPGGSSNRIFRIREEKNRFK